MSQAASISGMGAAFIICLIMVREFIHSGIDVEAQAAASKVWTRWL